MDGTQFEKKSFTVPVGSPKVSQEDWDRIFGKKKLDPEETGDCRVPPALNQSTNPQIEE